ncbi:tRNA pseudouridine synthase A [Aegicerativicinus sediminis]|uniref:tRNA pseudouridine synthase A n=1 Tax=Aegicerativicinus sediminis TaxID=2893202 RepID=UPI001E4C7490|nr:tRNA pseudouridine synthase A [Aegicerativicinus sediminis]
MNRFFYLIKLQYLGYRYHGWQKQPNVKTVQFMVDRTLKYILPDTAIKTLAAGRTDAKVSAEQAAFELFLDRPLNDLSMFLEEFNFNLPQDIRALSIEEVDENFNIIQDSKIKEYHYLFAYGQKFHPFCAPLMATILDDLDIEIMKKGASIFQGTHNFKAYCYKASEEGQYERELVKCELVENDVYTANFFPERTYLLKVAGSGFGRNQVRLMAGTLFDLGRGIISLEKFKSSLRPNYNGSMQYIAPASGLILHKVEFSLD